MQSGPFPPRISRIGTEEEEGRPGVGVAIEGRASAVAARPSLANDPFPSQQGESGRAKQNAMKRQLPKQNQPQTKLLKEGNKLKRKETFVIINSSKEITSNSKNRDRKLYFSMATLYAVRGTRYTAVTNEYERRMRVLRSFRGSYAKVIVSLKVNYSGVTF